MFACTSARRVLVAALFCVGLGGGLLVPRSASAELDLSRLVETRKLTLQVKAKPLAAVLTGLEAETKVALFLDPEGAVGEAPITLETKERQSFKSILDAVTAQASKAGPASGVDKSGKRARVTWKIVGGVIVVGRSSALGWYHLKAPRRKVEAAHGEALGKTRSLKLKGANLAAALKALGELTSIPIRRSAEMEKHPEPTSTVTLTARRPVHELVMLVFGRLRVVWTLSEAGVLLDANQKDVIERFRRRLRGGVKSTPAPGRARPIKPREPIKPR